MIAVTRKLQDDRRYDANLLWITTCALALLRCTVRDIIETLLAPVRGEDDVNRWTTVEMLGRAGRVTPEAIAFTRTISSCVTPSGKLCGASPLPGG